MVSSSYIVQAAQPVLIQEGLFKQLDKNTYVFDTDYIIPYPTIAVIKVLAGSTTTVSMKYQANGSGSPVVGYINNAIPLRKQAWNEFNFMVTKGDRINFKPSTTAELSVLIFANAPEGIGGSI